MGGGLSAGRRAIAAAIEVRGIDKRFTQPRPLGEVLRHPLRRNRTQALADVTFDVPAGTLCGLLGPNGAGKTTLLRILATTVLPDGGQVRLLGLDALRQPVRVRRALGVVLGDERSFYWRLTAGQNLLFFAALYGLPDRQARARIAELGALLELDAELGKPFRNLSTGWRHRLALARALLHDPPVLLMDEPTAGLDPGATERAQRLIAERLVAERGKTVLLASHRLDEVRSLCPHSILLQAGRLVSAGPTAGVLEQAQRVFALGDA